MKIIYVHLYLPAINTTQQNTARAAKMNMVYYAENEEVDDDNDLDFVVRSKCYIYIPVYVPVHDVYMK